MRPANYRKYSDEDIEYIKAHCNDKPKDVAAVLGAPRGTIRTYMGLARNGEPLRHENPPRNYYALYLRKTDELICAGTAKECAAELGIGVRAFYVMAHKALSGKVKKWDVYVEPYEELE